MPGWLNRRRTERVVARMTDPAPGTLEVTAVSAPPSLGNVTFSNYHLVGVVTAVDLPPTAVEQNGIARLAQWPTLGHHLPVTVDRANPAAFRISWDSIPTGAQQALSQARTVALQEQTNLNFDILRQAQDQSPATSSPQSQSAAAPILTGTVTAVTAVPTPATLSSAGGVWDLTVQTAEGAKLVRANCHSVDERDTTAVIGGQVRVRAVATNPDIAILVTAVRP